MCSPAPVSSSPPPRELCFGGSIRPVAPAPPVAGRTRTPHVIHYLSFSPPPSPVPYLFLSRSPSLHPRLKRCCPCRPCSQSCLFPKGRPLRGANDGSRVGKQTGRGGSQHQNLRMGGRWGKVRRGGRGAGFGSNSRVKAAKESVAGLFVGYETTAQTFFGAAFLFLRILRVSL